MAITVDLQKTIKVWCRLDNEWGRLDRLVAACNNEQLKNYIINEREEVDIIRHELMQACGFEEYENFVSFIELTSDIVNWDSKLNNWIL